VATALSLVLSSIAFTVASYVLGRYLDEMPKGMTPALIFSIALAMVYLVALAVDFF
jgi:hypothetical protein